MADFFWILSLAMVSVGLRNFEPGLSIDGPLYASIARNIARTGEWFRMSGGVPDFQPFAEHPHLGFWIQALFFKILPAQDWSARVMGHVFYVSFLWIFFREIRNRVNERAAVIAILCLWSWSVFSNFFSNFYLDPGALFFGLLFLVFLAKSLEVSAYKRSLVFAALSGFFLAASAMTKGLTILGFGPCAAALVIGLGFQKYSRRALTACLCLASASLVVLSYIYAVRHSAVPNFFDIYWSRQMTGRFSHSWAIHNIFDFGFWRLLLKDTYNLVLLAPVFFVMSPKKSRWIIPALLFCTFIAMYAPAGRIGGQYWIMVMPPLAWVIGLGVDDLCLRFGKFLPTKRIQSGTQFVALALVLVVQYLPITTHRRSPPDEIPAIKNWYAAHPSSSRTMVLENPGQNSEEFILSGPYAWYADCEISYRRNPNPQASLYLVRYRDQNRESELKAIGYHLVESFGASVLWAAP